MNDRTTVGVLAEIAAERERQIEQKGWSLEHDDEHKLGELGCAAIPFIQANIPELLGLTDEELQVFWPFTSPFKPDRNPRRNLVKAAALLVAELERIDRQNDKDVGAAERRSGDV